MKTLILTVTLLAATALSLAPAQAHGPWTGGYRPYVYRPYVYRPYVYRPYVYRPYAYCPHDYGYTPYGYGGW